MTIGQHYALTVIAFGRSDYFSWPVWNWLIEQGVVDQQGTPNRGRAMELLGILDELVDEIWG